MDSKQLIETLKNLLSAPFFCKTARGEYQLVNDAFALLAGTDASSIRGKRAGDLFDAEFAAVDELRDAEVLRNAGVVEFEAEMGAGDDRRFFSCRKMLLPARPGSAGIIACVMTETTALRKAEESLWKFNMGIEQSPASIVITDTAGTIQFVNATFTRITGYSAEEAVGKNPRILKSGIQSKEFYQSMWDTISSGKSWRGEFHNRTKTGEMFWEIASISPIMDNSGKIISYIAVKEDITHLKDVEEELRRSEEKNREILDAIPDIMFKMDRAGNYLDPALSRKISEVFPDGIRGAARTYMEKAFETGEIQIFEYPVSAGGEAVHYEARFIISGEDEILAIIRNITDRVRAESEMKAAREAAENASRSKSDFLANMSHEIRTPLNSITGFIGLLKKTALGPAQEEYLDIIDRSAENLVGIINDILDFSKIESGRIEIEKIPFNPISEFEPTIEIFAERAHRKNIALYSFLDPSLSAEVSGDPLRVKQVLINLLSNAIKFTPERGKIFVDITRTGDSESACDIRFSIRDTGIGIPERKQKLIFEAFSQADSSVTRRYGGTGLGLSISSNLISLMGGDLKLDSHPGMGSTFHFVLHMEKSRPASGRAFPKNFSAFIHCPSTGDPDIKILLDRYLKSFGVTPVHITRPGEAAGAIDKAIIFLIASVAAPEELALLAESFMTEGRHLVVVTGDITPPDAEPPSQPAGLIIQAPLNPSKIFNAIMELLDPGAYGKGLEDRKRSEDVLRFDATALVAEDNPVNQKLITLILQGYGIAADVATNGLDAYYMSGNLKYDIIFMDVNMPVTDGVEATQMMLAREKENGSPHVPIIALTAMAIKGDRERLLAGGMDDYLSKPIDSGNLEKILRARLHHLMKAPPPGVDSQGRPGHDTVPLAGAGIDLEKTASELGIPPAVLRNILVEFLAGSDEYINALSSALESEDMETLYQESHRLKGSAANLRLKRVAELAGRIEVSAKNGGGEEYGYLVASIRSELDSLKKGMQ